jgi:hypothetical protein
VLMKRLDLVKRASTQHGGTLKRMPPSEPRGQAARRKSRRLLEELVEEIER